MAKLLETLSFERVAADYESTRPMPPVIADRIARRCLSGLSPSDWFLDAGAGTGRIGRALAAKHKNTVGIDVSPAMLTHATGMHRALADLRNLPFPDGAFRGVLGVHILHLVPDWEKALTEVWRVVAPGGRLVLGFEERTATRVRELYLMQAKARGLDLGRAGATQTQIGVQAAKLGGLVTQTRPTDLAWSSAITVAQTLQALEKRVFSALWELDEAVHQELLEETRVGAKQILGSDRYTEVTPIQFLLMEIVKPA